MDPETTTSSAILDVNVGLMRDHDNLPGLALLLEHMLFLGTKKYPEENSFDVFLDQHGGNSNASTFLNNTNFRFSVKRVTNLAKRWKDFIVSLMVLYWQRSTRLNY